jgi:hypothetical protein
MRFSSIPLDLSCAGWCTEKEVSELLRREERETLRTAPATHTPNRLSPTSGAALTSVARPQIPTPDPAVECTGCENFGRCGGPVDVGDGSRMSVEGVLDMGGGKGRGEAEVVDDRLLRRL